MRRLLQKQTQSLQTARALAQAIRSDIPQSGLDPTYSQIAPQIIIQQSGLEQPSPIAPSVSSSAPAPGMKDPIAEELKRIDADVKHGLLDKNGDGANANIIKLGEQLKKVAEGIKNISAGSGRLGAREIQYDDERLSAIRMQAERYIPGMRESLGLGNRGAFSNLKNIFTSSPLKDFKLEDIDERSLFGGAIKRRMAERQYAEDQLSMIKTTKGNIQEDIQKQAKYQDEQGQFSEKLFRQRKIEQFRQQNAIRGEISKTMEEIDRLKHDEGYTDEQIKKTGLYKTLHRQEARLSLVDPDRFGKEVRAAKRKDYEQQLAERTGSVTPNDISSTSTISPTSDDLEKSSVNISEKESEQMLVVSQQTDLLKRIEENTRSLKGLDAILKSAMDKIGTASGGGSGDGGGIDLGGLGGLGDGPAPRRDPRGRWIGSKLKQLGKGAIQLGAKGARMALPYALPAAIAYGAARTLDYGASALGIGDVEIDETQDEANWQKMSTGQKIGSGIARGIESVGSFLGLESFAKEAEASRIEKETKMLQGQTQSSGASEQTIETNIKFNESVFAENDPENYKKFIEFKESRTDELTKQYIESNRYGKGREGRRIARTMAERRARDEAIIKFKNEIEAADAGSIEQTKTISDSDIEAAPVTVNGKQVGTIGDEGLIVEPGQEQTLVDDQSKTSSMTSGELSKEDFVKKYVKKAVEERKDEFVGGSEYANRERMLMIENQALDIWDTNQALAKTNLLSAQKNKIDMNSIEPPKDMGGQVYQESDELKSAEKVFAQQSQPATNIVNAPTTNVSQTTNNITRPSARNTDSTYREYSKSRFAW